MNDHSYTYCNFCGKEITSKYEGCPCRPNPIREERDKLRAVNAELLAVVERIASYQSGGFAYNNAEKERHDMVQLARTVLARLRSKS